MKTKIIYSIIAIICLLTVSCSPESDNDKINSNNQKRINIYPEEILFTADGKTKIGEEDNLTAIVTLNPHQRRNNGWDFSVVDNEWATVSRTTVNSNGAEERGLNIYVEANVEYRRKAKMTIITDSGDSEDFIIEQEGLKPDAQVKLKNLENNYIEFMADEIVPIEFEFESNMDTYKIYLDENIDWIHFTDLGNNKVYVTVDPISETESEGRSAKLYVHVGTPETSEAIAPLEVRQLSPDIYCFIWGTATPDYKTVDKTIKMTKVSENNYSINAYFQNGEIAIANYAKADSYPQYYLDNAGVLGVIKDASSAIATTNIPTIDIDGMRTLNIDIENKTYTLSRISTRNSLPDDKVSEYKTKQFIARDGSTKEWMLASLRWDGGNIIPKLGGKLVPTAQAASGGYNNNTELSNKNTQYEETENGGTLQGDDTHGRIYTFSEAITGVPRGGIDGLISQTFPVGWQAGDVITDAVGKEIKINYVTNASFTGDNNLDEKNHQTLEWQVQGICPYGWHIANAQDWLDLAWAVSKASAGTETVVKSEYISYKQFATNSGSGDPTAANPRGIPNLAPWLRNNKHWTGTNIASGADSFGFEYFPTGFRYLKQGWQMYGLRKQVWVPLLNTEVKAWRVNVVINDHASTYGEITAVDNGNAIMPFRCIKNYKK